MVWEEKQIEIVKTGANWHLRNTQSHFPFFLCD